ncbi:MAG: RNA methyltransferase [Nitrospirota bacterium]|nr:RNA methyltransferase [Nitrospirota bacterium]
MKNLISSKDNPLIKYLKSLQEKSAFRRDEKAFVVEGASLAAEAVASGRAQRLVVCGEEERQPGISGVVKTAEGRGVPVAVVPQKLMKTVSSLTTSPGVMAVVDMPEWTEDAVLKSRRPVLLLCGLQDPGNVGTIIRTAEAAGAGGIFCAPGTVDLFNPKVVRGSMGSILRVPVIQADDVSALLKRVGEAGYVTIATGTSATESCFGAGLEKPFLLLVGQEAAGVPADLLAAADRTISIPMEGEVESLNAAMATAIILFEAKRQRGREVRS